MSELPLKSKDFKRLADLRAREAGILARNKCEQGAYYLAGYAVECALKACIAKKTRQHDFPPNRKYVDKVYSHDLASLLKLAELDKLLEEDMKNNQALAKNWLVVTEWDENKRYDIAELKGKDLHEAITGPDGVLPWIKQRW